VVARWSLGGRLVVARTAAGRLRSLCSRFGTLPLAVRELGFYGSHQNGTV
jgi:hypothetical protein